MFILVCKWMVYVLPIVEGKEMIILLWKIIYILTVLILYMVYMYKVSVYLAKPDSKTPIGLMLIFSMVAAMFALIILMKYIITL